VSLLTRASDCVVEVGHSQAGDLVFVAHPFKLLIGPGETDLQSGDLAVPPLPLCFGDPGQDVLTDLGEPRQLVGVGAQWRAAEAGSTEMILK
jgi:hypothetical protein